MIIVTDEDASHFFLFKLKLNSQLKDDKFIMFLTDPVI